MTAKDLEAEVDRIRRRHNGVCQEWARKLDEACRQRDEFAKAAHELIANVERWNDSVEKIIGRQMNHGMLLADTKAALAALDKVKP